MTAGSANGDPGAYVKVDFASSEVADEAGAVSIGGIEGKYARLVKVEGERRVRVTVCIEGENVVGLCNCVRLVVATRKHGLMEVKERRSYGPGPLPCRLKNQLNCSLT